MGRLLVSTALAVALTACVPMPQRVQDEFSRYDGERPNNFLIGRERPASTVPQPEAAE